MHVITNAPGQGTEIENSAAPAPVVIAAGRSYDVMVDVRIDSGSWTLYVYQAGTATVVASWRIMQSTCNPNFESITAG